MRRARAVIERSLEACTPRCRIESAATPRGCARSDTMAADRARALRPEVVPAAGSGGGGTRGGSRSGPAEGIHARGRWIRSVEQASRVMLAGWRSASSASDFWDRLGSHRCLTPFCPGRNRRTASGHGGCCRVREGWGARRPARWLEHRSGLSSRETSRRSTRGSPRFKPETRFARFLMTLERLDRRTRARLACVDHRDHEAITALASDGTTVGIARYMRTPGSVTAEVAVAVVDRWRGRNRQPRSSASRRGPAAPASVASPPRV